MSSRQDAVDARSRNPDSPCNLGRPYSLLTQPLDHSSLRLRRGLSAPVFPRGKRAGADEVRLPTSNEAEPVLVVEDDPEVRANTAEMLRQLSYAVLEAPDGPAALCVLEAEPNIRLLFTDVGLLGGVSSRQLADHARRVRPDLKMLYCTGYARNAIVHHGRVDPGVELLAKPFTLPMLAKKIRLVLKD